MKLPILVYPSSLLRKRSKEVLCIDAEIRKLVQDMIDTLDAKMILK